METKNFLFFVILGLNFVFSFVGCRTADPRTQPPLHEEAPPPEAPKKNVPDRPLVYAPGVQTGNEALPPSSSKSRFVLIVGPGGPASLAALGVFQEMDKLRVIPTQVLGIEWGSLAAALYSVQGKAFDAQWKFNRWKLDLLPKASFFKQNSGPQSIDQLQDFLVQTFESKRIESAKIPFQCPSQSMTNFVAYRLHTAGTYLEVLKRCLPYPPYFFPSQGEHASPFVLNQMVQTLKQQNVAVVFINFKTPKTSEELKNNYAQVTLTQEWNRYFEQNRKLFDDVLDIDVRNEEIKTNEQRRTLMEEGRRAGEKKVLDWARKYGN